MGILLDVTGERFGRLVAAKRVGRSRSRESLWLCICDCGATTVTSVSSLRSENTRSCGCLHREELIERSRLAAKDVVTYGAVHWRLRASHGPAARFACVECGAAAGEWSYDGSDVDALRDVKGRPYSMDLHRYQPRCVPCHRTRDRAAAMA